MERKVEIRKSHLFLAFVLGGLLVSISAAFLYESLMKSFVTSDYQYWRNMCEEEAQRRNGGCLNELRTMEKLFHACDGLLEVKKDLQKVSPEPSLQPELKTETAEKTIPQTAPSKIPVPPQNYSDEVAKRECRKVALVALEDAELGGAAATTTVIVGPGYANCLEFEVPLATHSRYIDIRLPTKDGWWDIKSSGTHIDEFIDRGTEGRAHVFRNSYLNPARADSKLFRVDIVDRMNAPIINPMEIRVRLVAYDFPAVRQW